MDFINIMSYDLHGSWENFLGFNAPLYGPSGDMLTVDYAVNYWLSNGAKASKLNIGLATYGRSFSMASSSFTPKSGAKGPATAGRVLIFFFLFDHFL